MAWHYEGGGEGGATMKKELFEARKKTRKKCGHYARGGPGGVRPYFCPINCSVIRQTFNKTNVIFKGKNTTFKTQNLDQR